MIITKDMLDSKGVDPTLLTKFQNYYPFDLDTSSPYPYCDFMFEIEIARIFSYTCLRMFNDSRFSSQINFINGKLENLLTGAPCVIEFALLSNKLNQVVYYTKGKLNNPGQLIPAYIRYYGNGNIEERTFYENGVMTDPMPGVPAFTDYDENGTILNSIFYTNGKLVKSTFTNGIIKGVPIKVI